MLAGTVQKVSYLLSQMPALGSTSLSVKTGLVTARRGGKGSLVQPAFRRSSQEARQPGLGLHKTSWLSSPGFCSCDKALT